jgi:hypothetical protein
MSDYNWRGITVSARRPAVEGYIEPRYRPAENLEVYGGVSGSNADLPNRSRAQIVYYAGTRPTFGALLLDVGGWYIDYPGGTTFNSLGSAETCTAKFGGPTAVTPINPSGLVSNWCSAAVVAKLAFDLTVAKLR